ncbi:hypothetical protein Slin15195_G130690 [Septoria linicola]|uniref:Uncharacterized protein n=1 Tax=Septoria linicola TaxID=215465 RepID=A0A9Q9B341_9PEZI|nr:hypothetical protein Slin15195_G130690 [Septoria linicola]
MSAISDKTYQDMLTALDWAEKQCTGCRVRAEKGKFARCTRSVSVNTAAKLRPLLSQVALAKDGAEAVNAMLALLRGTQCSHTHASLGSNAEQNLRWFCTQFMPTWLQIRACLAPRSCTQASTPTSMDQDAPVARLLAYCSRLPLLTPPSSSPDGNTSMVADRHNTASSLSTNDFTDVSGIKSDFCLEGPAIADFVAGNDGTSETSTGLDTSTMAELTYDLSSSSFDFDFGVIAPHYWAEDTQTQTGCVPFVPAEWDTFASAEFSDQAPFPTFDARLIDVPAQTSTLSELYSSSFEEQTEMNSMFSVSEPSLTTSGTASPETDLTASIIAMDSSEHQRWPFNPDNDDTGSADVDFSTFDFDQFFSDVDRLPCAAPHEPEASPNHTLQPNLHQSRHEELPRTPARAHNPSQSLLTPPPTTNSDSDDLMPASLDANINAQNSLTEKEDKSPGLRCSVKRVRGEETDGGTHDFSSGGNPRKRHCVWKTGYGQRV